MLCLALAIAACSANSQGQAPEEKPSVDIKTGGEQSDALPPNINPFLAANKRDKLDSALERLARRAMSADLTTNEPWLFDRATTYYKLSLWSKDNDFKSHALDLVEHYYSLIDDRGEFRLKLDDTKYSYTDGAVWYEHETGDKRFRPKAEAVYDRWLQEFPSQYSIAQAVWTEREIAYAFGAALGWYELSGDSNALVRSRELVNQWKTMSEGTGAPLHTLAQHQEEFEPPWFDQRMTSPWMAALFFEYLQHYERLTGDTQALKLVSDYADFLLANCLYDGSTNHPNLRGYLMPYYLCGEQASYYARETPSEGDGEHTPDVMGLMAFAVSAKRKLGVDEKPALDAYRELRKSAAFFVSRRSDVEPPRKISWWFGTSYDSTQLVQ
jgi:hypothetical protein